jgi:hypothetical protein
MTPSEAGAAASRQLLIRTEGYYMKMSVRTRALVIVAASASLLAVPLAMPASAATQPGKCTKLTTKTVKTKLTATLTGCTPTTATGGSGTGSFNSTGAKTGTINIAITWATKHGTTKGNIKFGPNKAGLGKCPKVKGESRDTITGKVTGGSGTAFKTIKTGQTITGSVCLGAKADTLEPGTALKF